MPKQNAAVPANIGLSLGIAIAVAISWSVNHSIPWAILHGFLNWIYVIYYALGFGH